MTVHSQITADPLEAIRATLAGHRIALTAMLEANAQSLAVGMRRRILDNLDERARTFLKVIADAEKRIAEGFHRGALIMLSIHGGAPAIADIIRQSEQHRRKVAA